jgi:hypothetical protein
VTLTTEEYAAVAKVAKKEEKTPNAVIAETVRVWVQKGCP